MNFDEMWAEGGEGGEEGEEDQQPPPNEYLLRDGLAKYKILADILAKYFHAKHGEPLKKIFPPTAEAEEEDFEKAEFKFHL
jgi:hypothetical protein